MIKCSLKLNLNKGGLNNVTDKTKGHFVQTFLPGNAYRALHSLAKKEDKTLDKYLKELIIKHLINERRFSDGETTSNEERLNG